jgi:hypothetical protein
MQVLFVKRKLKCTILGHCVCVMLVTSIDYPRSAVKLSTHCILHVLDVLRFRLRALRCKSVRLQNNASKKRFSINNYDFQDSDFRYSC